MSGLEKVIALIKNTEIYFIQFSLRYLGLQPTTPSKRSAIYSEINKLLYNSFTFKFSSSYKFIRRKSTELSINSGELFVCNHNTFAILVYETTSGKST